MKARITQIKVIDGKRFAFFSPAELGTEDKLEVGSVLELAASPAVATVAAATRPPTESSAVTATKTTPTPATGAVPTNSNQLYLETNRSAKDVDVPG